MAWVLFYDACIIWLAIWTGILLGIKLFQDAILCTKIIQH
jgi:hypothetical protein